MAWRQRRRRRRIRLTRAYLKIHMSLEGFFFFFLLFNQGEQKDDNNKNVVIIHKSQIGFSIQNGVQEMSC